MTRRIDIVTDLETLGVGSDCPVFQLGAVAINLETGEIISTFNGICDITNFNNIEGGTLKWWLKTNKDLLAQLILSPTEDESVTVYKDEKHLSLGFLEWAEYLESCYGDLYLWGNGILFDNRIIESKCKKYGVKYPIKYYNDRDLRTIYELAAKKLGLEDAKVLRNSVEMDNRVAHDGLNDAYHEALVLHYAWKILLEE